MPGYVVQFLGAGTPLAINNWNQAVGFRDVSGARRAVLFDGTMQDLPSLAAAPSCEARDINEMGSIVGFCAPNVYQRGRAVIWEKSGSTYTVTEIPTFAGDNGSSAVAINNFGEVVGTHNFVLPPLGMQVGAGFVWRASSGSVDVLKTYGLNDFPVDINDAGQVLLGQKILNLRTSQVTDLGVPPGPPAYFAARTAAISANGNVAGVGIPASSSSPQSVIRYRGGSWQVLGGWGQWDGGSGVNDAGTVVGVATLGGGYKGVIWFDQMRTLLYADDFLLESERDWVVLSAIAINGDDAGGVAGTGRIIAFGQNHLTGEYGGIMLIPAGPLPVPIAPSSLQATPRQATWQQPYNAIALSWSDNSRTDFGFRVERTLAGQAAWVELARVNGNAYEDTAGSLGVTYDYRVRAIGLAGDSAASATARATFPSTAIDTNPPTVAFVAPASGAQVSGNVQIVVDASDDRGVNFVDVQYQPNMGQARICSAGGGGALTYRLTCTWNTRDLAPGSYELTAYASDAIGNYKTQAITVQVGSAAASTVRVSSVTLSASTRKGKTTVAGVVVVVNQAGTPVQGAGVSVNWTTPAGPATGFAYTDRKGLASFAIPGRAGTFRLTVTNVVLTGYVLDLAASQLSGTILVR
ncbi:MAG: Ig-like domain-containing protein [Thermoanaerobaculia bacterium]